ncbi:mCG1037973 [Mus musculus]|nr:mCG1037973 [Mus musculus]
MHGCSGSPAGDRRPGRQTQGPFNEDVPQNLKMFQPKIEKPKHTQPCRPPSHNHHP